MSQMKPPVVDRKKKPWTVVSRRKLIKAIEELASKNIFSKDAFTEAAKSFSGRTPGACSVQFSLYASDKSKEKVTALRKAYLRSLVTVPELPQEAESQALIEESDRSKEQASHQKTVHPPKDSNQTQHETVTPAVLDIPLITENNVKLMPAINSMSHAIFEMSKWNSKFNQQDYKMKGLENKVKSLEEQLEQKNIENEELRKELTKARNLLAHSVKNR